MFNLILSGEMFSLEMLFCNLYYDFWLPFVDFRAICSEAKVKENNGKLEIPSHFPSSASAFSFSSSKLKISQQNEFMIEALLSCR
jgi:hypothetical protein